MELKKYLASVEKTYPLRLKTVQPIDEAMMASIETAVAKYVPTLISKVHRTIMQANPLDFSNIKFGEVYIVDFVFSLPVAASVFAQLMKEVLKTSVDRIVVRQPGDPIELESEKLVALADMDNEAKKNGWKLTALVDLEKHEDGTVYDPLFGNEHTSSLLYNLRQVELERNKKMKPVESPFSWLNVPETKYDFGNSLDHIKDASKTDGKDTDIDHGLVTSKTKVIKRTYTDEKGEKHTLERETNKLKEDVGFANELKQDHSLRTDKNNTTYSKAGAAMVKPVGRSGDNPMTEAEVDQIGAIHAMLSKAGFTDMEIRNGLKISKKSQQKMADKLAINVEQVAVLLNTLMMNLREDDDKENLMEEFTYEKDSIGNVTVRDSQKGDSRYLSGSKATDFLEKLTKDEPQSVMASLFNYDDMAPVKGTYNFPWKLDNRRPTRNGTGTVSFGMKDGAPDIEIIDIRDSDGESLEMDDADKEKVLLQAIKFIKDA